MSSLSVTRVSIPPDTATCSGVWPLLSAMLLSAPSVIKSAATSASPVFTAHVSRLSPDFMIPLISMYLKYYQVYNFYLSDTMIPLISMYLKYYQVYNFYLSDSMIPLISMYLKYYQVYNFYLSVYLFFYCIQTIFYFKNGFDSRLIHL